MTEKSLIERLNKRERKLYDYVSGFTNASEKALFKCNCCNQIFEKQVQSVLSTTSVRCKHVVPKLKRASSKYVDTDLLKLTGKEITLGQLKILIISRRYDIQVKKFRDLWEEGYRGKMLIKKIKELQGDHPYIKHRIVSRLPNS